MHCHQMVTAENSRILLVEDNDGLRELMTIVLRRAGYQVFEAADDIAALDLALAHPPALVIVDLRLPGLSGDEVILRMKSHPATQSIPVIVTTALPQGDPLVKRALAAGALEVFFKPIDLKTLLQKVTRYAPIAT
jgi:CheY-like chemotaxis protein